MALGGADEVVDPVEEAFLREWDEARERAARTWTDRIEIRPVSGIAVRRARWLWHARIPVGEITLVPGREGVGKSIFLAWLTAAITRGDLPGEFEGRPRGVIYVASEDSWSYTIVPRLIAAGADLDRVHTIRARSEEGETGPVLLPRDTAYLPEVAHKVDAAALLCDPIISLVDDRINTFHGQELRRVLEPLRRASEEAGMACVALVHFNKSGAADVGTLISGSRAWAEVARAVLAIAVDREAEQYTCVVTQTKNALGRLDQRNLSYTIESVLVPATDGDADVGRLAWLGESERGVEDILAGDRANTLTGPHRGETTLEILEWVNTTVTRTARAVTTSEVCAGLPQVSAATVRGTLRRLVDSQTLRQPMRGHYLPAGWSPVSRPVGDE